MLEQEHDHIAVAREVLAGGGPPPDQAGAIHVEIERPLGHGARQAGDGVDALGHAVAALLVDGDTLGDEGLVAVEGGGGGGLADGAAIAGGL